MTWGRGPDRPGLPARWGHRIPRSGCASTAAAPKARNPPIRYRSTAITCPYLPASSSPARAAPSGTTSQRESRPASRPMPSRASLQVLGDRDQVDHHHRHQQDCGHAPAAAFQGERLEVLPGYRADLRSYRQHNTQQRSDEKCQPTDERQMRFRAWPAPLVHAPIRFQAIRVTTRCPC